MQKIPSALDSVVFVSRLSQLDQALIMTGTVMRIIKFKVFPVPVRLHSGYGKLIFVIILPCFAIFKHVVHSLDAPNYAQRF